MVYEIVDNSLLTKIERSHKVRNNKKLNLGTINHKGEENKSPRHIINIRHYGNLNETINPNKVTYIISSNM